MMDNTDDDEEEEEEEEKKKCSWIPYCQMLGCVAAASAKSSRCVLTQATPLPPNPLVTLFFP